MRAGDLIYISPPFPKDAIENPFKAESRSFPVEYAYPVMRKWIVDIQIPEGYLVESMPASQKISSEDGGIALVYRAGETQGKVQLVLDVTIRNLRYEPEQYPMLRGVYDAITAAALEQIVLKKA